MLANGATLGYATERPTTGSITYTTLDELKELPDLGVEPEKVENTVLTDGSKKYENGIGDPGDMTYKFKYTADIYETLMGLANGNVILWKETTIDGTSHEFEGQCAVKRVGGGVNAALEIELAISLSSDITPTYPA